MSNGTAASPARVGGLGVAPGEGHEASAAPGGGVHPGRVEGGGLDVELVGLAPGDVRGKGAGLEHVGEQGHVAGMAVAQGGGQRKGGAQLLGRGGGVPTPEGD